MFPRPAPAAAPPRPYAVSEPPAERRSCARRARPPSGRSPQTAHGATLFHAQGQDGLPPRDHLRFRPAHVLFWLELVSRSSSVISRLHAPGLVPDPRAATSGAAARCSGVRAAQRRLGQGCPPRSARGRTPGCRAASRRDCRRSVRARDMLNVPPGASTARDHGLPGARPGRAPAVAIVAAIRHLNRRAVPDVPIVARGSGSPRTAPSTTRAARALAASRIPTTPAPAARRTTDDL